MPCVTGTEYHDGTGDDFGCKLKTIQMGQPDETTQMQLRMEARQKKDLPAYKRMRDQGLLPPHTKGAAELETRARTQFEVEHALIIEPTLERKTRAAIDEAQQMSQELALNKASGEGLAKVKELMAANGDPRGKR